MEICYHTTVLPDRLVVPPSIANTVKLYASTLSLSSSVVVVMNPDEPSIAKGRPDPKMEYTIALLTPVDVDTTRLIMASQTFNFFSYNYIQIHFLLHAI